MTSLKAALDVGAVYPVFPCGSNKRPYFSNSDLGQILGKQPGRGQGGCKIATQDPEIIKKLWKPNPKALVGVHTVELVCIDWDAYKDDHEAVEWVKLSAEQLNKGRVHATKSGGWHFIFQLPPGIKLPAKIRGIDSIDIKSGVGSYFIWPTEGSGYTVSHDVEPPLLPQDLVDAIGGSYGSDDTAAQKDWTPNSATDAELVEAVMRGEDYHGALATLTMRWANRARPDGTRLNGSELMAQALELIKKSAPTTQERRERREQMLQDDGGELTRLCEGAVERARPLDPFDRLSDEEIRELTGGDVDDPFAGLDMDSSPFFTGNPELGPEEQPQSPKVVVLPQRKRLVDAVEQKIPPRQWVHGHYLIKGHMSMTAAPGGTGKSTAVMTEMMELATGHSVTGQMIWRRVNVLYINGEDPTDELERRMAALCAEHGFDPAEVDAGMEYVSGRELQHRHLVDTVDREVVVNEAAVAQLVSMIKRSDASVLSLDPLSSFHGINENSNSEVRVLMDVLRDISHSCGVSIHLVHHSVKEALAQKMMGHEQARGASAFLDACRIVRTMRHLTKEENVRCGLPEKDKTVIRTVIGKGNMVKGGTGGYLFKLKSHEMNNGDEVYPDGDSVAVIELFDADLTPSALDDLSMQVEAATILLRLGDGEYRAYPGSGPRHASWLGHTLMAEMSIDAESEMDRILSLLEQEGMLGRVNRKDKRKGRTYEAYVIDKQACSAMSELNLGD